MGVRSWGHRVGRVMVLCGRGEGANGSVGWCHPWVLTSPVGADVHPWVFTWCSCNPMGADPVPAGLTSPVGADVSHGCLTQSPRGC